MIPIVTSVALVCFLLVHITPGDPLVAILPADASQLRISVLLFSSAAQAQCAYFYVRNSS